MSTPEELTMLPYGWDGYQGKPVTLNNCNTANKIAEALEYIIKAKAQFVPGTSGDIQIEYHTPGQIIEIHIEETPNDRS